MAKPEWGIKRFCRQCDTRYYDLGQSPPICPVCHTVFVSQEVSPIPYSSPLPSRKERKTEPLDKDTSFLLEDDMDEIDMDTNLNEEEDVDS